MYYHVILEINERDVYTKQNIKCHKLDMIDTSKIITSIIKPYLEKKEFHFEGRLLKSVEIKKITITQSNLQSNGILGLFREKMVKSMVYMSITRQDVVEFDEYTQDITDELISETKERINLLPANSYNQQTYTHSEVFVVHGHDELAKNEVARFIETLDFKAVILHEQVNAGQTLIEKIEYNSNVGFGIAIYSPCDIGASKDNKDSLKPRARQNVVFEHGFLIGKLGRYRVCALLKDDVEKPSDIDGILYIPMDHGKGWHQKVAQELKAAGYDVDLNKLLKT